MAACQETARVLRWPPDLELLAALAGNWLQSASPVARAQEERAIAPALQFDQNRFLETARQEGLESVAHLASAGSSLFSQDARAWLRDEYHATAVANAVASDDLSHIVAEFTAQDIPVLVLKGAFLAHVVYRNIAARRMGDLDLLVEPRNVPKAHRILTETFGMRPLAVSDPTHVPTCSPFLNSYFYFPGTSAATCGMGILPMIHYGRDTRATIGGRGVTKQSPDTRRTQFAPDRVTPATSPAESPTLESSGIKVCSSVHLHWHLVNASYPLDFYSGMIDMAAIWKEHRVYEVSGLRIPGLAPHHLLIHLCEHGLKHAFSELRHLVDIAAAFLFMAGADRGTGFQPVSPTHGQDAHATEICNEAISRFIADTKRFGLERATYYGLVFAAEAHGIPVLQELLDALRPAKMFRCELRFVQLLARNVRKVGLNWLIYFAMMKTSWERLKFVVGTFWPRGEEGNLANGRPVEPQAPLAPQHALPKDASVPGKSLRALRGLRSGLDVLACLWR